MRTTLKQARLVSCLTQQQVADKLHITVRHYQRIESGDTVGKAKTWDELETMFGIPQIRLRVNTDIIPDAEGIRN